jgi:hypothetical protein
MTEKKNKMEAKEKAKELVDKFSDLEDGEMYIGKAKQCALIAVDEILNTIEFSSQVDELSKTIYWQKVKQELKDI